jgi:hypothetical protein
MYDANGKHCCECCDIVVAVYKHGRNGSDRSRQNPGTYPIAGDSFTAYLEADMMSQRNRNSSQKLITATFVFVAIWCGTICLSGEPIPPEEASWHPRSVAKDELRNPRGEVEDKLRTEVLGAFSADDDRLGKLREVLNGPWNGSAVEYWEDLVLTNSPVEGKATITAYQWIAIANMLAYEAKTETQRPVVEHVQKTFDRLFERAVAIRQRPVFVDNFWGYTADAVARYGTAKLLTESYWQGLEKGLWAPRVLESVGDADVLKRLKDMWVRNQWPVRSPLRDSAAEAISLVEMQLSYPELKQIKNTTTRYYLGKRLPATNGLQQIEGMIQKTDNAETRQVLEKISERLKKQSDK